jgi:hypothetical protein
MLPRLWTEDDAYIPRKAWSRHVLDDYRRLRTRLLKNVPHVVDFIGANPTALRDTKLPGSTLTVTVNSRTGKENVGHFDDRIA